TGSKRNQNSWQFTKMFQLHSPDILFNSGIFFNKGVKLNIVGTLLRQNVRGWEKTIKDVERTEDINRKEYTFRKVRGSIHPSPYGSDRVSFAETYRTFISLDPNVGTSNVFNIYGKPEITERGASPKSYNGDGTLVYRNNLKTLMSDRE